jgi:hypothetical protein
MDITRFDVLTRAVAVPARRRTALRLLVAGLFGAVLPSSALRAAQRTDRDFDGLFDDDEVEVYGTNPDVYDTDADGVGDGEEIYNRDQGLSGPSDPLTPAGGGTSSAPPANTCPAGTDDCGSGCQYLTDDKNNCGACGNVCSDIEDCRGGVCQSICISAGEPCQPDSLYPCCAGSGCAPVLTGVGEGHYCLVF